MGEPSTEEVIKSLDDTYAANKARITRYRFASRIITWVTVGVFFSFAYAIYSKVAFHMQEARWTAAVRNESTRLAQVAKPYATRYFQEVGPIYRSAFADAFNEVLPELKQHAKLAVDDAADRIKQSAGDQMEQISDRALNKQKHLILQEFPTMKDDKKFAKKQRQWKWDIQDDTRQIVQNFYEKYTRDVAELKATLKSFRSERLRGHSQARLTRQLVHLALLMLDRLVLEEDVDTEEVTRAK